MRLSDYKGEDALELIADIIDPVAAILSDKDFEKSVEGEKVSESVKTLLKNHKRECMEILARINKVDVKEYKPGIIELTRSLMDFMSNPEIKDLFTSQGQIATAVSSGSVMENTEGAEK